MDLEMKVRLAEHLGRLLELTPSAPTEWRRKVWMDKVACESEDGV